MVRTTYFTRKAALCVAALGLLAAGAGCSDDTTKPSTTPAGGADASTTSPVLDDHVAGGACKAASDCKGASAQCATTIGIAAINATPAPDGYCTANCSTNEQCGAGSECIGAFAALNLPGKCQKSCTADTDCGRDGYVCSNIDLSGIGAATDGGIDPSTLPTIPKSCVPKIVVSALGNGVVGKGCAVDTDCSGGKCALNFIGQPNPGGYCTGSCNADTDCGSNGVCAGAIVTPIGAFAGTCLKSCASDTDCRSPEYSCQTNGFAGSKKVCQVTPPADGGTPAATDAGVKVDAGEHDAGVADAG